MSKFATLVNLKRGIFPPEISLLRSIDLSSVMLMLAVSRGRAQICPSVSHFQSETVTLEDRYAVHLRGFG